MEIEKEMEPEVFVKECKELMKNLHPFTEPDYDGFAGVESDYPLINESVVIKKHGGIKLVCCIMIIDDVTIEIYCYQGDEDREQIFSKEFASRDLVVLWLEHEAKRLGGKGIQMKALTGLYGFEEYC